MNKDDLVAWKNFDNNQYSLIPGFQNKKLMSKRNHEFDQTNKTIVNGIGAGKYVDPRHDEK